MSIFSKTDKKLAVAVEAATRFTELYFNKCGQLKSYHDIESVFAVLLADVSRIMHLEEIVIARNLYYKRDSK